VLEVGVGYVLKYIFFLVYYELLRFELGLQQEAAKVAPRRT
jgi:hypothetical protein